MVIRATLYRIKRVRRKVKGKPRYINFAQDKKGRIISWGFWSQEHDEKWFEENKVIPKKLFGAHIRFVITVKYHNSSRPYHFYIGEVHVEAEYLLKDKDAAIIMNEKENAIKDNVTLIELTQRLFDEYNNVRIGFNINNVGIISHDLDVTVTQNDIVDVTVYVRGRDVTNSCDTSMIREEVKEILYVSN